MRTLARSALVSIAYAGLTLAALVQLVVTLLVFLPGFGLGMVFLLPRAISSLRRFTNTWRRIVGRLSNVDIAVPYKPHPAPPRPDADGYYRHDRTLHKTPRIPAFFDRLDWVLKDRGTGYDFLWLLTTPVAGALFGLLPLGLVAGGLWWAPWGLLAIPVALLLAPATNALFARWTRYFLQPPAAGRITFFINVGAAITLVAGAILELILGAISLVALACGTLLGVIPLIPLSLWHFRWLANLRRRGAKHWSGIEISRPYRPIEEPELRPDGMFRSGRQLYKGRRSAMAATYYSWIVKDVASWRDLAWLLIDPFVTIVLVGLPAFLFIYGIWGLALPSVTSLLGAPHAAWYGAVDGHRWLAAPVGAVLVFLAFLIARPLLRVHAHWTAVLLSPTKAAELRGTVARLTKSRTEVIDAQSAEVRRIERDLHDGAQARLVAVGLTLGTIERLMETDPPAARKLLAQARETSAAALSELRDLVRGILPPVLSERGLGDALRALAMDASLPVTVHGQLPGRFPAPVESAAYFAVSEALANATRYAEASNVAVGLRYYDGVLRMTVTDDGVGGADPSRGTGLHGIERRLGSFDGTLTLHSPQGGPTVLTMEVPCALSSPRISSSSETA
jgi:signal transduction histidine kinase